MCLYHPNLYLKVPYTGAQFYPRILSVLVFAPLISFMLQLPRSWWQIYKRAVDQSPLRENSYQNCYYWCAIQKEENSGIPQRLILLNSKTDRLRVSKRNFHSKNITRIAQHDRDMLIGERVIDYHLGKHFWEVFCILIPLYLLHLQHQPSLGTYHEKGDQTKHSNVYRTSCKIPTDIDKNFISFDSPRH